MNKQLLIVSDEDLIKAMDLRTVGRKVKELLNYFSGRKDVLMDIRTNELFSLTEEQVCYFGKFRNIALDAVNILQQMEKSQQSEKIIESIKYLYANRHVMETKE
jgi:hypothetical protein